MPKITYVFGDDWEGVYLDGELVAEGHRITLREFAKLLGHDIEVVEADEGWLGDLGNLPNNLTDVVRYQ